MRLQSVEEGDATEDMVRHADQSPDTVMTSGGSGLKTSERCLQYSQFAA